MLNYSFCHRQIKVENCWETTGMHEKNMQTPEINIPGLASEAILMQRKDSYMFLYM